MTGSTIVQMLITGMILIIIATVTLAVLSYGAFKIRDRKTPKRAGPAAAGAPMFFERVRIANPSVRRDG
jgi:heme/copper-type cytochrome/quinol oxidase subunit 2